MHNLSNFFKFKKNTTKPFLSIKKKPIYYDIKGNIVIDKPNKKYSFLECKKKININWRYAAYDVYPPLPPRVIIFKSKKKLFTLGIKILKKKEYLGIISLSGKNIGEMSYYDRKGSLLKSMGDYYILTDKNENIINQETLTKEKFLGKISQFFGDKEIKLFEKVTKKKFNKLILKVRSSKQELFDKISSNVRWIDTPLNKDGLHILRVMLADKNYKHKIQKRTRIPDEFLKNGFFKIPFNKKKYFLDILRDISPNKEIQKKIKWRRSVVKFLKKDEQTKLHNDSFHNTFKVWVYPKNLKAYHGPLEVIPKTHINSYDKLKWLYYISNTNEGNIEPSFRLSKKWQKKFGKVKKILPIKNKKTIIIANTYIFHRRGIIKKNLTRITFRLSGDNDGGIRRVNPFN